MYNTLKIALVQMDCVLGNKRENLSHALSLASQAVSNGANLIVFPEMFSTGYELHILASHLPDLSESEENCPTISALQSFAKENQVSICCTLSYYHTNPDGKPNISCFYINKNGKIQCIYDKNHLFGEEKNYFSLGQNYSVFDTEFGKIGLMVCYDANFPEPARILACKGAEIIICTAAWRVEDISLFDIIMPLRAAENTVYLCANNRFGKDAGRYTPGHSQICGPTGNVLFYAGECETILYGEINASNIPSLRKEIPYLNDLRENEYPQYLKW